MSLEQEYKDQYSKPLQEFTLFGPDSPILFKGDLKLGKFDGISGMEIMPFVFAVKEPLFGVGLVWRRTNTDGYTMTCEWDKGAKDYTDSWRAMQVLSHCELFDGKFCEAALDFVKGTDWGDRESHQYVSEYNLAVSHGQELSHLERLHLALGRPSVVEQVYREVMGLEIPQEEVDRVDKLLRKHGIR